MTMESNSIAKGSKKQLFLSSSPVAHALRNKSSIFVCLFICSCISLQLKPIESGYAPARTSEAPNRQFFEPQNQQSSPRQQPLLPPLHHQQQHQQQQQQQQQQHYGPPPGPKYPQQPRDMVRGGPMQPPSDQVAYPMQPNHHYGNPQQNRVPNHRAQGPDYPMQSRNYPVQQHQHQHQPQQMFQRVAAPGDGSGRGQGIPVPMPMAGPPPYRPQQQPPSKQFKPTKDDPCGTINISEMHGYQIREYKITTKDRYELVIHRLIHPAMVKQMIKDNLDKDGNPPSEKDLRRIEPKLGDKKPYLLLHGLVGSSASFVRNVDKNYQAPSEIYDINPEIEAIMEKRIDDNELYWQSTADKLNAAFDGDNSNTIEALGFTQRLTKSYHKRTYAKTKLIDFYGDKLNFAREFTQAFRKFELPVKKLKQEKFIPNSLAFTLSNFGYDVWLANFRGNEYSKGYNGPLNRDDAEYWDFDLDQLVRQDLLASINHIKNTLGWKDDKKTMGLISYSYSSLHILGLLSTFPQYQRTLQPVIMMAPILLTSSGKSTKSRMIVKAASQFLISHTGPFPDRSEMDKKIPVKALICKLPLVSKLCNLMTLILNGKTSGDSMRELILDDPEQALMLSDSQCGQTSTRALHQIVDNISRYQILPKYTPYVGARNQLDRGDLRRSILIIRSKADGISNEAEVERIKDAAIKGMALSDVVIEEPKFGHADFLFSKKNQFLVNAEVARMALVFDHMSQLDWANQKMDLMRG